MRNKSLRKKKMFHFLTAACLIGTLTCTQFQMAQAVDEYDSFEEAEKKTILDVITIESPVTLEEIELPKCEYGKLIWANPYYIPEKAEEDCEVLLKPEDGEDVSWMEGWDNEEHVVHAYITVFVKSYTTSDELIWSEEENPEQSQEEPSSDYSASEEQNQEEAGAETEGQTGEIPLGEVTSEEILLEEIPKADDLSPELENIENAQPDYEEAAEGEEIPANPDPSADQDSETLYEEDHTDLPSDQVTDGEENKDDISEETDAPDAENTNSDLELENESQQEIPNKEESPEENTTPEEETEVPEKEPLPETIFDREEIEEDLRPQYADEMISEEEKQRIAYQNHTCEGISVTGNDLPWYVQFRVSDGNEYEFSNQNGAELFKAYEFELWDTLNEQEYEVPDGSYLTVRMTVPAGYHYTIEHILSSGGKESIRPTLDGMTLVFSTHSFSPFGIAGSTVLIGGNIMDHNYQTPAPTEKPIATPTPTKKPEAAPKPTKAPTATPAPTEKPTATPKPTKKPAAPTTKPEQPSKQEPENKNHDSDYSKDTENHSDMNVKNTGSGQPGNSGIPNTGDTSPIGIFAGIASAAFLLIVMAAARLIRKKK